MQGIAGEVHVTAGELARHAAGLAVTCYGKSGHTVCVQGPGRVWKGGGGGRGTCQLVFRAPSALEAEGEGSGDMIHATIRHVRTCVLDTLLTAVCEFWSAGRSVSPDWGIVGGGVEF